MSGLMCDGRTAAGGAVRSLRVEGFSEIFIGTDRGAERKENVRKDVRSPNDLSVCTLRVLPVCV